MADLSTPSPAPAEGLKPWEKYAQQAEASKPKPWEKYGKKPAATYAQIMTALRNAHAAGDTAAARRLAAMAKAAKSETPSAKQFIITAPDGKKYKVTGPDQAGALAALKKMLGGNVSQDKPDADAPTEVELPDGTILEFPAGTDRATMKAATAKYWAKSQGSAAQPSQGQPTGEGRGIVPAMPMPRNPELVTQGPGPTGMIAPELYDKGILPRRYVEGMPPSGGQEEGFQPSAAGALSQGVLKGVTFGFNDEIAARIMAATNSDIDYDTALASLRNVDRQHAEAFPKTALAGEIGGAVALPGKAAASFINKGATTASRMGRGAIAGATAGAVAGFGAGEGGVEERAANAASGAALGALGGGAIVGLGQGFNKVLQAVTKRPELREIAPTLEGLRDEASRLYSEARESGALMPESAVKKMVTGIQWTLKQNGFDNDLHPRLKAVLNRLTSEAGDKSLADIEVLRRVAGNAAESLAPDERRLAGMVIDKIDDAIEGLGEGGATMKAARETWGRLRRMETIESAIERAGLAKANFASALQSEFRALLKSPRKLRGFTAPERAAIAKIARGGPVAMSLQALGGAMTPTRPLGALLTGGAAFNFGPAAVGIPVAGFAATKIADAMARRGGNALRDSVGRSDTARQIVEELARTPNALAAFAPAAAPVLNALAGLPRGE